jgi:hypothetical protein
MIDRLERWIGARVDLGNNISLCDVMELVEALPLRFPATSGLDGQYEQGFLLSRCRSAGRSDLPKMVEF